MTGRFPEIAFDKLFERVDRRIMVDEETEYACVGVRLEGRGVYVRERKTGTALQRKIQWMIEEGDVVYNKLFAWRGAFAVVGPEGNGCIGSDKFPTYRMDESRLLPSYCILYFRSPLLALKAKALSKGAAALSKFTLNPPDFWRLTMPLPSLDEQEEIVQWARRSLSALEGIFVVRKPIDAVLQGRRASVGSEVRLIMQAALHRLNEAYAQNLGVLDDVLTLRPRSGPSFPCSKDPAGIPVIMPSSLGGYRLDLTKCLYGVGIKDVGEKDRVDHGDLLISRGNKRDQVGLCVVYDGAVDAITYANLLMRMQVERAVVMPEFVKYWLMSPMAVTHIRRHTKGTSPAIQKINQGALIRTPFPKGVPMDQQERWVVHLNHIFAGVDQLEGRIRGQYIWLEQLQESLLLSAFGERVA